ncbi:MAG: hypothetical protein AB7I38_09680 [Dehalococcoidia bacterium]
MTAAWSTTTPPISPSGVEFLCFSEGIDLENVPRAEELATALRAFAPAPA